MIGAMGAKGSYMTNFPRAIDVGYIAIESPFEEVFFMRIKGGCPSSYQLGAIG